MATKTSKRKRAAASVHKPTQPVRHDSPPQADQAASLCEAPSEHASSPAEKATIELPSVCGLKDAATLKAALLQRLDEPSDVTIEAGGIERIDTAVVQLLCAFVRDRARRDLPVQWRGTSQPLLDAARLLGVGSLLALSNEGAA